LLSLAGVEIPRHIQGQAFLGEQAVPPREYIYASRDRHDESYDMVRAARDKRFKYMRNYYPERPYLLWIPYRNRHPILQEMWRLYMAGELEGPQLLMFQPRPVEELYDTQRDPYETHNLAGDPAYKPELERLRKALDAWIQEVGDMGKIPEAEMVRRWYPNGKQPETAPPLFIPICEENLGQAPAQEGGTFKEPLLIQIHCATQGASIAYTFEQGDDAHWHLYTDPLRLPVGETTLRAKAIRIGYRESKESSATFVVEKAG
jgi:N-sulfoglucosamine sulfohydrolase